MNKSKPLVGAILILLAFSFTDFSWGPIPWGSSNVQVRKDAGDDSYFVVVNKESDTIVELRVEVNGKYDGIYHDPIDVDGIQTIYTSNLSDDYGVRFNPYTMKMKKLHLTIFIGAN